MTEQDWMSGGEGTENDLRFTTSIWMQVKWLVYLIYFYRWDPKNLKNKQTNKKPNPKQSALHSNQLNVIHSLILKKKTEPEMSPHTEDKCCLANWVICIKDEVIQLANQEASLPILQEHWTKNAQQILWTLFHCEYYQQTVHEQFAERMVWLCAS